MNIKATPLEAPSKRDLRSDAQLWIGILGGPVLWLIQFQTIYTVAGWGCALHSKLPLYFTSSAFFVFVIITGVIASRHLSPHGTEEEARRTRFMARVGVMSSALSLLVIIAQALATIMVSSCME